MGHFDLNGLTESSRALNEPECTRRALWEGFRNRADELDGLVYECVSSTRVYCRPTCKVKRPKLENCFFAASAAEAEALGYRPCLRCHPELAPGTKTAGAERELAWRAMSLIREFCSEPVTLDTLSHRLRVDAGEVESALRARYGACFGQLLLTCRLHIAKGLLSGTDASVGQVAQAAGFADGDSLGVLLEERYRIKPAALKKGRGKGGPGGQFSVRLAYREPYGFGILLAFFRARELAGVERIDGESYSRTVRILGLDGAERLGWVRVANEVARSNLVMTLSPSLLPVFSQVIARVRRQFDLDCEPAVVHAALAPLEGVVAGSNALGTRVPGAFDSFEIAVRAVLGQQVSVKAANKLAARIVERFGRRVETGPVGLERLFPSAEDFLAIDSIEDALGELGVVRTRSRTIRSLAELVVSGELDLGLAADTGEQMKRLLAVKGIGPWSQNYIAMRALGYTDAFLETDAGIKRALPKLSPAERARAVEGCRPWRAYANVCLWNSISQ